MITLAVSYPQLSSSRYSSTHTQAPRRKSASTTVQSLTKEADSKMNKSRTTQASSNPTPHQDQQQQKQQRESEKQRGSGTYADQASANASLRGDVFGGMQRQSLKVEQLFEDMNVASGGTERNDLVGAKRTSGGIRGSRDRKLSAKSVDFIQPPFPAGKKPAAGSRSLGGSSTSSSQPLKSDSRSSASSRKSMTQSMSGSDALQQYAIRLTEWEKNEITAFRTVYFLGQLSAKNAALMEGEKNNGFDNSEGFLVCKPHDHILYRYEILDMLGTGTFGQVVKAMDHKAKKLVAVKIVKNERPFLRQAREEIRILETLRKMDSDDSLNIVHILDSFSFRGHVCIVFELLGISLHEVLRKTGKRGFSLGRTQRVTRGILRGMEALQKNRIIHCDLKPENILLRRHHATNAGAAMDIGLGENSVKIIDFGSSCYEQQQVYTYIQSRYYRAPEVILGTRYTCAIDMWSLACVVGEMLLARPLFPGENEFDQMACYMEVRGLPPPTLLDRCKSTEKYFTSQGQPRYVSSPSSKRRGPPMSVHLSTALKNCEDTSFLDFMRRALTWDPSTRLTPSDALLHPWITRGAMGKSQPQGGGASSAPVGSSRSASILKTTATKSTPALAGGGKTPKKGGTAATNNNSIASTRPPTGRVRPQTAGSLLPVRRSSLPVPVHTINFGSARR